MMNLKRHAYCKPFSMRRYSTIEDNMTKMIRNLILMSDQNKLAEKQINNNFHNIQKYLTKLALKD